MGLKSSHWSCLKACFKGYTFCFTTFLVRPSTGAQQSHEQAPITFGWSWEIEVSSTSSKFHLCASLKTCDLQILGNALKCLKGNLSTKKQLFPNNFELRAKFCGVQSKPGWRYFGGQHGINFHLTRPQEFYRRWIPRIERRFFTNTVTVTNNGSS